MGRERATIRTETRWFTPPPEGAPAPKATEPPPTKPRSRRPSIREDDLGDAVRLSSDSHDLIRRTVPRLILTSSEVAAAPLDHRDGFLLAHIDGKTSVQALIDISGMPDDDLLSLLQRLRRLGIITLG